MILEMGFVEFLSCLQFPVTMELLLASARDVNPLIPSVNMQILLSDTTFHHSACWENLLKDCVYVREMIIHLHSRAIIIYPCSCVHFIVNEFL